jgi:hypothetical protein
MRIKRAIFAGVAAALASLTAPALAHHSKPQPVTEPPASSSCSAMQPMPDGTWQRQPCQESAARIVSVMPGLGVQSGDITDGCSET